MDLPSTSTPTPLSDDLTLMEEVLLLCLRNTGNISGGIFGYSEVSTGNGLAGAVIMELSLRGRLAINEKGELSVVSSEKTGDDLLDEAIEIMKDKKNSTMDEWLKSLNGTFVFHKGIKEFRERLYDRLCTRGILRRVQKVVGTKHTFKDVTKVDAVAEKIRTMAKITDPAKSTELSDHDYSLLALFYALDKPFQNKVSNCLDINRIFPDTEERNQARNNVEALINHEASSASEQDININVQVSKKITRKILVWSIKVMTMGIFSVLTEL